MRRTYFKTLYYIYLWILFYKYYRHIHIYKPREFNLKLSSKNEELETKDKEISYLKDEIFKLKLDIDYWKNLYETGLSGMKNNSTENSTQVNDSINSKNVTFEDVDKKNQELNLLKQKYEAKVKKTKTKTKTLYFNYP